MTCLRIAMVAGLGFILLAGARAVLAQSVPDSWPEGTGRWLQGYARSISGEAISYHSAQPDINSALLVRAMDEQSRIEWETEAVPGDWEEPFATFIWAAGMATRKGRHRFELQADGRIVFSFQTASEPSRRPFRWLGENGSELVFVPTRIDQFDELFGYMFCRLPAGFCQKGKPLRLAVVGEPAGSRDWYMTFQSGIEERLEVRAEPVLLRRNGRLVQLMKADIVHLGPATKIRAVIPRSAEVASILQLGYQSLNLSCDPVEEETRIPVEFRVEGRDTVRKEVRLRPVRRWRIHFLPHSHGDIGYSDLQRVVEKKHWAYFEQAIELARSTAGYPPEARFKWNVEILWAVETYLAQASEDKRRQFIEAVKQGDIGLQAFLVNPLTGLCSPEELIRLTDYARSLSARYGLNIDSAMISDIPGSIWSIVPALAMCGVKYYSSGPNYMPFLPDGGDRIGWSAKAWGDRPFYWISPSGREKILFWMTGRGYSWFHGLNAGDLSLAGEQPIFDYLQELEEKDYPYDIVQVRYTIGGDNGPPDPALPDFVRSWNEKHESPQLIISTSSQLFSEFEKRYGDSLPEVKGDFTPYWEDGALSTVRETVRNRDSASRLLQSETLWTMLKPAEFPHARFAEAWRQVVLFDEHTWGAHHSVSEPDHPEVLEQWEYKRAFARDAEAMSRGLLAEILGDPEIGPAIDVYNTTSWTRSGLVVVPAEWSRGQDRVRDQQGRPVPSQRLRSGELAWLASDIPAIGALRFFLDSGVSYKKDPLRIEKRGIANAFFCIEWDEETGTFALFRSTESGGGIQPRHSLGAGLNDYVYVPGRDPGRRQRAGRAKFTLVDAGPLVATLRFESDAPGCSSLIREIRVVAGLDHLEVVNSFDKKKIREKESLHFAFPFEVPDGVLRADVGWGVIEPEKGQLAGSCKDFLCVHNWVDISNATAGLTWITLGSPLVEPGAVTSEIPGRGGVRSWKREVTAGQTLYSYVANNYWHTNYKADQEGDVTLRYAIRPHSGYEAGRAKRFGLEMSQPLIAAPANPSGSVADSLFEVRPDTVIVSSVRPSEDGNALMIRLYNASESAQSAAIVWGSYQASRTYLSSPFEEKGRPVSGTIELPPFGIMTFRAEKLELSSAVEK
jgi:alpha-mannosidase